MRSRCFSVGVLLVLLSFLFSCGKTPQTAQVSSFTADLSFESNGVKYDGSFAVKSKDEMQLILRKPTELQGLYLVFESENTILRVGEASLSFRDAEAIGLPVASIHALFQTLAASMETSHVLSEDGTVEILTDRGTAFVTFMPERQFPKNVTIGEENFSFDHQSLMDS